MVASAIYLHLIYKMRIFGTYYSNIYGPTTMLNVSNPTLYYLGGSKSLIYNFYEPLFCRVESLAIKMLPNNKLIASNTKNERNKAHHHDTLIVFLHFLKERTSFQRGFFVRIL